MEISFSKSMALSSGEKKLLDHWIPKFHWFVIFSTKYDIHWYTRSTSGGPISRIFPTRKCNCSLQGWPKTLLSEKLLETWGRSSLDSKVPHVSIIFSLWNRIQTYAFHGHAQLNKVGLENVHDSPGSSSLTTVKAYRILYTSPSHLPEPKDSGTKKDVCLSGVWWWGLTEVWTCDAIFPNISKVKPPVTSR